MLRSAFFLRPTRLCPSVLVDRMSDLSFFRQCGVLEGGDEFVLSSEAYPRKSETHVSGSGRFQPTLTNITISVHRVLVCCPGAPGSVMWRPEWVSGKSCRGRRVLGAGGMRPHPH